MNLLYKYCKYLNRFDIALKFLIEFQDKCGKYANDTFYKLLLYTEHLYLSIDHDVNNQFTRFDKLIQMSVSMFSLSNAIVLLNIEN